MLARLVLLELVRGVAGRAAGGLGEVGLARGAADGDVNALVDGVDGGVGDARVEALARGEVDVDVLVVPGVSQLLEEGLEDVVV